MLGSFRRPKCPGGKAFASRTAGVFLHDRTAPSLSSEVYAPWELARAAGVPEWRIRSLIGSGAIATIDGEFSTGAEALRVLRGLARGGFPSADSADAGDRGVHAAPLTVVQLERRRTGLPLALSSAGHAAVLATAILVTTAFGDVADLETIATKNEPVRLVYLTTPGPGGGGGGGGLRQRTPPPRALRKGSQRLNSPLPARRDPPPIAPVEKPVEPPPPVKAPEPLPPVVAPVVTAPADDSDRAGVLEQTPIESASRGSGTDGGVGSGAGTGIGEGDGPGIGPGSGGGTGGGPYRPGSGIVPPRLLREVKADYTEQARQRGIEGEVVLEIVVRSDGAVGEIRVVRSLGYGLEDRATAAVRQWRFAPATRLGRPVDVLVEVGVEFRLR
jgi:TonB family protein